MKFAALFAGAAAWLLVFETATANTYTVSNLNDSGTGSLRNAIIANNALGGGNTINFAPGLAGTITLQTGQLDLTADTTIVGPGARVLTVDGNAKQRVFRIPTAANVDISGLTINNGAITSDTGAGIQVQAGQLTLTGCAITNNIVTSSSGGGVWGNAGTTLTLNACTVSGNQAPNNNAGGIGSFKGTLTLTNCTVANNTAYYTGGGIYVFQNAGTVNVSSSTIAANHLTVATNQAAGGGIYFSTNTAGVFILTDSIVADNTNARADNEFRDVFAAPGLSSGGYNLISSASGLNANFAKTGDQIGVAANLGGLHNNGGPTDTIVPLSNSPAIDNGNRFGVTTDGRGFQRPYDQPNFSNAADASDIGAVEVQATQPAPNFTVTTTDEHSSGFCEVVNCSLWDAATAADNNAANNSVITFGDGVTGTIFVTLQPAGIFLTRTVNIIGPGARVLTLNGGGAARIFSVSGQDVVISGLRLAFGLTHGGTGGAITNDGGLTLNDCQIDNNAAMATSRAAPNGGAIQNNSNASLTVNRCTFYFNSAAIFGGAINSAGALTATNSTFVSNSAQDGGGVDNFGGTATLLNCTVTANQALGGASGDEGGGLRNQGSSFTLTNTIVAANVADDGKTIDLDGAFISGGANVIGRLDGATSFVGSDPNYLDKTGTNSKPLDPGFADFGDHGGPTATQALAAGSTAIDSANPNKAPPTDERGFTRTGSADVGAFEFNGVAPTPTPTPTPSATPTASPTLTPTPTATATPAPPSQLLNLSTRKQIGTGDNVLIGGFIVVGTDVKTVLLRGLGPSLPVNGALADPTLELHDASTALLAFDDNWKDKQQAEIEATGIPPSNDVESAIVASLPAKPGDQGGAGYTGVLAGSGATTGIGLLEIYDLDAAANSKLANISTRGFVGTGDDLLIGGFIPGPSDRASLKVLVRALGPSLAAQGVSGVLQDPLLELHDANGILLQNDNWRDAGNADEIQATLPPPDDHESAIITTLAPSNAGYTAVVRGANGTTGVALVEVYGLE